LVNRGLDVRPTRKQKRIALAIAAVADLTQLALAPLFAEGALSPLDDLLDVGVAIALTLVLGWRWRTALAMIFELIPGVALFPSWTAVVATLPSAVPEPDGAPALLPPPDPSRVP
jgi:hypothetical protein